MRKVILSIAISFIVALAINNVYAATTFLPDWLGAGIEFSGDSRYDEPLCENAEDENGNKLYYKASGCAAPKVFDERCPHNDAYISQCYCPAIFSQTCSSPYVGDSRVTDPDSGYSSCDGQWIACCNADCPTGTSRTNPGGCGGFTYNDCGDICYYPYKEDCCTPLEDEIDCAYGTTTCSDDCEGTRVCCVSCTPLSNGTNCSNGTESCDDGCGGTRQCCKDCTPLNNETNCIYGTYDCDDGCGGTRQCCSTAPACDNSYKYTCSGIGYSGGKGTACEGQYTECNCSSGYTWNSGSCDYCGDSYKYSCSGTGYSSGSSTAYGGKYTSCNCSSGYTWDGSACVEDETNCTVGMIYYSDGSCSSTYNSSKNIIGVIGHIDTGTNTALIIQINSSLSYYWDSSSTPIDTSLENYQGTTSAVDDKNGYSNTTIMISELGSNATAAKYCADLSVKVTLTGICHLPVNWNILYMIIILQ